MNLLSAAELLAGTDRPFVELDKTRCLHHLSQFATCEACYDICPVEAIQPAKPPTLDNQKCQQCGACLAVCPTDAYRGNDGFGSLLKVLKRVEAKELELVCNRNPYGEQGFSKDSLAVQTRECLVSLGWGAYLILAALGFERILIRTDACADCVWAQLQDRIKSQVDFAKSLLKNWAKSDSIQWIDQIAKPHQRPIWDVSNPPLSRRDFFRMAIRQGEVAFAKLENLESNDSFASTRNRTRMMAVINHFPIPESYSVGNILSAEFATLTVSEDCSACGVCARVCTTQALTFNVDPQNASFQLLFSAQKCVGCDLCQNVCLPEAIQVKHEITPDQLLGAQETLLQQGDLVRCERCGTLMAARPAQTLCPTCEKRRQNPFASILPPHFQRNFTGENK
ncbi:MAG: 4Fe-4S dicluster domain-containing protein [Anaerolineales bacterium]